MAFIFGGYGLVDVPGELGLTLDIEVGQVVLQGEVNDLNILGILGSDRSSISYDVKKGIDMPIAAPNVKYKLGISRSTSTYEEGTANISATGAIIGAGTSFTEILRDNTISGTASKIKFDSSLNTGEYTVQSIADDAHIVCSGTLVEEAGVKYSVVGTHSSAVVVTEGDKYPFRYDSYELSWIDFDESFDELTTFQLGVLSYDGSSVPSVEFAIQTSLTQVLSQKLMMSGFAPGASDYFVDDADVTSRYTTLTTGISVGDRFLVGNITAVNPDGTDFSSYKGQVVEWTGFTWTGLGLYKDNTLIYLSNKNQLYKKSGLTWSELSLDASFDKVTLNTVTTDGSVNFTLIQDTINKLSVNEVGNLDTDRLRLHYKITNDGDKLWTGSRPGGLTPLYVDEFDLGQAGAGSNEAFSCNIAIGIDNVIFRDTEEGSNLDTGGVSIILNTGDWIRVSYNEVINGGKMRISKVGNLDASDIVSGTFPLERISTDVTAGLKRKVIEIGDWNMEANSNINIAHEISDFKKIRRISAVVRGDADTSYFGLPSYYSTVGLEGLSAFSWNSTNIGLSIEVGGFFNSAAGFSAIELEGTPFNRGWVIIEYLP